MDATDVEVRILGCLIEKQRTTPDVYPLSLNALRLACNQATNRDPVVQYDEETIRVGLAGLSRKGWARLASGRGSRVVKYRHLLDEALGLTHAQCSLLGVLMLRGPQTPGELKLRTERLHPFATLHEVDEVLDALIDRELVSRLPRRPGQKETRYVQLLAGNGEQVLAAEGEDFPDDRFSELEARMARLEEQLASVLEALDASGAAEVAVHADEIAAIGSYQVDPGAAADDVEPAVDGDEDGLHSASGRRATGIQPEDPGPGHPIEGS